MSLRGNQTRPYPVQDEMLTDITPNWGDNLDVIVPDNEVHKIQSSRVIWNTTLNFVDYKRTSSAIILKRAVMHLQDV